MLPCSRVAPVAVFEFQEPPLKDLILTIHTKSNGKTVNNLEPELRIYSKTCALRSMSISVCSKVVESRKPDD